jgi:hypothetical protein
MPRSLTLLCLLLVVAGAPAAARPPANEPVTPPPMQAVRLAAPVTVDGRLDEAVWQGPPVATRLLQSDPEEGAAATESTWVWVAWDDEALYVAARMFDSRPDSIIGQLVRRDVTTPSDRFMVFVDPFRDKRSGYYFAVNVAGVLYDGTLFNDGWDDDSWDGVWSARAQRGDTREGGASAPRGSGTGWTCEIRIPFSQMRFRRGAEQVVGRQLRAAAGAAQRGGLPRLPAQAVQRLRLALPRAARHPQRAPRARARGAALRVPARASTWRTGRATRSTTARATRPASAPTCAWRSGTT